MYRNGQHTKARLTSFWPLTGLPINEASMVEVFSLAIIKDIQNITTKHTFPSHISFTYVQN